MKHIVEYLEHWANEQPNNTLFEFEDRNQIEKYSYQQFNDKTKVTAHFIKSNCEYEIGDRVLLVYPQGLDLIITFMACVRLGLVPVPSFMFQKGREEQINYIVGDCTPKYIFSTPEYKDSMSALECINSDMLLAVSPKLLPETEKVDDIIYNEICFLQYTSGSTSNPKGVMVTHENLITNGDLTIGDLKPIGVSWLPQNHDMGLIGYHIFIILKGGSSYGIPPIKFIRDPIYWLKLITKHKATATSAPNFAFAYCLEAFKRKVDENIDLSSLQNLMIASEPILPETFTEFNEYFSAYGLKKDCLLGAYGLAENTLTVSQKGSAIIKIDKKGLESGKIIHQSEGNTTTLVSSGILLEDTEVKIVDPDTLEVKPENETGEIWIAGKSKCLGYWNKPELTADIFYAKLNGYEQRYLRTGDIGFLDGKDIYICGRLKDTIILRGMNYYPHDIEKVVWKSSKHIRDGHVVAFSSVENKKEELIIVVGVKNLNVLPNISTIAKTINVKHGITPYKTILINAKDIQKTTSGKIKRYQVKSEYEANTLNIIESHTFDSNIEFVTPSEIIAHLLSKYEFDGLEDDPLYTILDSLDLAILVNELRDYINEKAPEKIIKDLDPKIIQDMSLNQLNQFSDLMLEESSIGIEWLENHLRELGEKLRKDEQELMMNDSKYDLIQKNDSSISTTKKWNEVPILLTGATGFFGPFLLRSLISEGYNDITILIRANSEDHAYKRIQDSLKNVGIEEEVYKSDYFPKIKPVIGDLAKVKFGLSPEMWDRLASEIGIIYNNGALVNYLYNYMSMRATNVDGTKELLEFCLQGSKKILNHISTTFIFGWATKDVLYEHDINMDLSLLDFGYSQTKWVSERLINQAIEANHIGGRIFRPALISPSIDGLGFNYDIAIRLLSFMINHEIGVDTPNQISFTPADIGAMNMVKISMEETSINKTYHVTRDTFNSMVDVTDIVEDLTGLKFKLYPIDEFIDVVINKCTQEDILYPLLDFLKSSVDNIANMKYKRYDSSNYQNARSKSKGVEDPHLIEVVRGILIFMNKHNLISTEIRNLVASVNEE